jgi:hypothetical protein
MRQENMEEPVSRRFQQRTLVAPSTQQASGKALVLGREGSRTVPFSKW